MTETKPHMLIMCCKIGFGQKKTVHGKLPTYCSRWVAFLPPPAVASLAEVHDTVSSSRPSRKTHQYQLSARLATGVTVLVMFFPLGPHQGLLTNGSYYLALISSYRFTGSTILA